MFKLSIARALAGQFKQQLVALDEILSNHTEHECVPTGLLARVYKERGAALVMAAASANDDPDDREVRAVSSWLCQPVVMPAEIMQHLLKSPLVV